MFVYMMFNCRRKAIVEELYQEFSRRFGEEVRDYRLRNDRSRDLHLLFRASDYKPFLAFAKEMARDDDFIKEPIEFAYDDGRFQFLFVYSDRVVAEEDWDHSGEYIHTGVLTGVRDDTQKALKIWSDELQPTQAEVAAKKERLSAGRDAWEAKLERDQKRLERRSSQGGAGPAGERAEDSHQKPRVKYSLPPKLSKAKVLEVIQRLNASGEVLIPVFILRDEIDTNMSKDEMLQLHLAMERSRQKSGLFESLKRAVGELRDS